MIRYLKLPFQFDAARMQEEVQQLSTSAWQKHYQVRQYEGEWTAIPLRSLAGKADDIIIAPTRETPYEDTVFLLGSPYLQKVLGSFQCPLLAVRLLKLGPGAVIKEHRDAELCFEKGEIRIHIPVITHDDVEFCLENERIHMREGECWYMNFNLPHRISNNSGISRIHLVIDAVVNDWAMELFDTAEIKDEIADAPLYTPEVQLQIIAQLRSMNTTVSLALADDMESRMNINNKQ